LKIAQTVAEISLFSRCFATVFRCYTPLCFGEEANRISSLRWPDAKFRC